MSEALPVNICLLRTDMDRYGLTQIDSGDAIILGHPISLYRTLIPISVPHSTYLKFYYSVLLFLTYFILILYLSAPLPVLLFRHLLPAPVKTEYVLPMH